MIITANLQQKIELAATKRFTDYVDKAMTALANEYIAIRKKDGVNSAIFSLARKLKRDVAKDNKGVVCSAGCSFCCYITRDITEDEATLMKYGMAIKDVKVSRELLEKQASVDYPTWRTLSLEDRRCPVLSKNGMCKIYDYRPLNCINHRVVGNPIHCDSRENYGGRILNKSSVENELIVSMIMNVSETKSMAAWLLEKLEPEQLY